MRNLRKNKVVCSYCKSKTDAYQAGYDITQRLINNLPTIESALCLTDSIGYGTCDSCIEKARLGIKQAWEDNNGCR